MTRDPRAARLARPWPRILRYIVCGHYHAADTGKPMTEAVALRDLDGVKEILADCARCRKAKGADKHKRLPDKPYDMRP